MGQRGCQSYRTLISALLDGELDPDEHRRLDAHLTHCESCRQVLADYREITDSIRTLPPAPPPPPDLARVVRKATVERPHDASWMRWFGFGSRRLGFSTATALALLVITFAFFMVNGYQQNLSPSIVASNPAPEQNWPVYQPVRIEFTKPMNRASVEAGLRIAPVGERERLPLSWDGNTLVIGSAGGHSELLLPDTSYTVVVLADVRDANGNPLGNVWQLTFHTARSNAALAPPVEVTPAAPAPAATLAPVVAESSNPTATEGPRPLAPPPTADDPAAFRRPAASVPSVPALPSAGTLGTGQPAVTTSEPPLTQPPATKPAPAPATHAVAPTPPSQAVGAPPKTTLTPEPTASPAPQPTATATVIPPPAATQAPAATATPTTAPTAAATAPAAAATTPTAAATATRATTPTSTATPVATARAVPVSGAFGSVYWANADVRAKLGAPKDVDAAINAQELGFQRGTMYERLDNGTIYSLLSTGSWSAAKDSFSAGDPPGGGNCGEPNLFQPKTGFFKLWTLDTSLRAAIGCATKADALIEAGRVQEFAQGFMLYSEQGFVYVLYGDGSWKLYPDTSGHGALLTPTPEPTATATPTAIASPAATSTATPASRATPSPAASATPRP